MADDEQTKESEEPISSLALDSIQSRQKISSLLAPLVIAMNLIGTVSSVVVIFSLSGELASKSGTDLLEDIKSDYAEFQLLDTETRESMDGVRSLETQMDYELSARGIEEIAALILETEQSAQLFLRLLKVNMYNLAGFIPGTASWYELYSPEVDDALARSRSRQLKLLTLKSDYIGDA